MEEEYPGWLLSKDRVGLEAFRDLNSLTSSMGQEKSHLAALVAPLLSVAQYQRDQAGGGGLSVHCDWGGALSGGLRGLPRKLNGWMGVS